LTSDIAWGLWNRHSAGSLSNINYLFSVAISNMETRQTIDRAMISAGETDISPAPGYTFRAGTDDFVALLGMRGTLDFSTLSIAMIKTLARPVQDRQMSEQQLISSLSTSPNSATIDISMRLL
jgi:hypothetical protein